MAPVNFYKLPAAQYNAEIHGNSIFQASDTGQTWIFGEQVNAGILYIDESDEGGFGIDTKYAFYSKKLLDGGYFSYSDTGHLGSIQVLLDAMKEGKVIVYNVTEDADQSSGINPNRMYIGLYDQNYLFLISYSVNNNGNGIIRTHQLTITPSDSNLGVNIDVTTRPDRFVYTNADTIPMGETSGEYYIETDSIKDCINKIFQELKGTTESLENHKNDQDKKHIPEGGHEKQILSWKASGEAKWEDLANVFTGLEEILAYGVQWDTTVGNPELTRVGNMSLHKTLPIQSQLKGCIAQGDQIMYWLDEEDWRWRKDPITQQVTLAIADTTYTITADIFSDKRFEKQWIKINDVACQISSIATDTNTATLVTNDDLTGLSLEAGNIDIELGAVLNGYDGTVRIYVPYFYIKSYSEGNIRKVYISTVQIDNTWTMQHEILVDAYRCTVLNTVPEDMGYLSTLPVNSAISVVNTESYCRGGGNRSANDTYLETDPFRTDLGKPRTSTTRANMRTYARNTTSELLSYEQYKNIFYWLWVIEYANFNSQATFNDALTSEGYRQGGMGNGITTVNGNYWNYYNGYYPLTPCGYGNQLGNRTGLVDMQVTMPTTSGGDPTQVYNLKMPRWRGFDNPFGDIWTNLDGILIDTPLTGASDTGVLPTCYIITDPANYTDTLEGIEEKADRIYSQPHSEGYIKEWHLGSAADMVPQSTGRNTTQFKCDYYWVNYDDTPETLWVGGRAGHGSRAGLGYFDSSNLVSNAAAGVGFRSASAFVSAEQQQD